MDAEQRMIQSIHIYHCGYCINNLGIVFRGMPWKKRKFPAMAVLLKHAKRGYILYDSGYSEDLKHGGIAAWLYGLLNPFFIEKEEQIRQRLEKDGISPGEVRTILLSHAHPDHIGGLRQFYRYELIALPEVLHAMGRGRLRDLVFRFLLPDSCHVRKKTAACRKVQDRTLLPYFGDVYDLLGDGSILGIRMDGHSPGQMGICLPEWKLLFAADACWGKDLVSCVPRMRLPARLIQNNFSAYQKTLSDLSRLHREHPEIRIYFSHQTGKETHYE